MLTIGLVIGLLIIFLLALAKTRDIPFKEKSELLKQLDDIKYTMTLSNPYTNRDGIVRLDAILSKALQLRHKNSLGCGENLKKSKPFLSKKSYNDIWFYHKLRNQIVHENIEINNDDAVDAFQTYSDVILKLLK
ncbi:hypothetical protein IT417_00925 [bacterium]|nr:hypothetical protein [bacterium]